LTASGALTVIGAATFSAAITSNGGLLITAGAVLSHNDPIFEIVDADGAADAKRWRFQAGANALAISTANDADSVTSPALGFTRSGNAVATVTLYTADTARWSVDASGNLLPGSSAVYTIGNSSLPVSRLNVSGGSPADPGVAFRAGGVFVGGVASDSAGTHLLTGTGGLSAVSASFDGTFTAMPRFLIGNTTSSAFGATAPGAQVKVSNNTSGSGAAGTVNFRGITPQDNFVWADTSGNLRIATAAPEADGAPADTSGTVVGTQASQRASKNIFGAFTDNAAALATILRTPLYEFDYKSGAFNHSRFMGIVTDDSPEFGMDLGRSFSPATAFGYTVASFKAQQARIEDLQRQIDDLKRGKQ
jgi:hypothetical protein